MSYTIAVTVDLGPENTGATLNGQLYDNAGVASGGAINSGIVELGTFGIYQYVATLADGFVGSLVLYKASDSSVRAAVSINPQEVEYTDTRLADTLLKRSVSNVEDTASTHSLAEIILAMLESSAPSTTWTIRKTDGSTFSTRTLTEDANALPVTGVT